MKRAIILLGVFLMPYLIGWLCGANLSEPFITYTLLLTGGVLVLFLETYAGT